MKQQIDNDAIKARMQKETERMQRSIREAPKYFIDPEKRTFISHGWGWEDCICDCGKRLFVKKSKKCSWHYHNKTDETLSVINGKLHVLYSKDDDLENACEIVLMAGDALHIPPGLRHRFVGLMDTEFIEFSVQSLGPIQKGDDMIRIIKGD